MDPVTIRNAKKEDMTQVLQLIKALADYEKEPHEVEITVEELQRDGFGSQPAFRCFVAEVNGTVEGMAFFYPRYSTWKGKTIHLEDLMIRETMRGKGIGSALFAEVIKYGYEKGVKRIEWGVLNWNAPAIAFYEKNGAEIRSDWDVVQLDKQGIKKYIENANL